MAWRVTGVIMGAVLALLGASCSRQPKVKSDHVPTYPVIGEVYVDGQPADKLEIHAIPTTPLSLNGYERALGAVTDMGKFKMHTYDAADGLPAGDYALTFVMIPFEPPSPGKHERVDQLNGKYDTAEKSPKKITVAKDTIPLDVGRIELTTQ